MTGATEFSSEFMGRDAERFLVYRSNDGGFVMDFRVTECCQASAKGCSFGVGCRKCYQPVDDRVGGEPKPPYTRDGTVTYETGQVPPGWEVFHKPGGTVAAVSPEGNVVVIAQYTHRNIDDPGGYDRNGAFDGAQVVSDADPGL